MDDDMYPNDGQYFGIPDEPQEQKLSRKREKAATLQNTKALQEIVEHLQKRIDFYGSVDAIPADVKTKPTEFLIVHNSNELARDSLQAELDYIQGLLDAYAP